MPDAARPLRLGEESIPPGEDRSIAEIVRASLDEVNGGPRPMRRGQHPKGHGCVRAEFIVEPRLPADLARGLFAEPKSYPCLIRFSNGAGQDDRKGDAHGMAIKLLGIPGAKLLEDERYAETQDFILLDNPCFFIADARSYARFASVVARARKGGAQGLVPFLKIFFGYLWSHPRTLLLLFKLASKKPTNPLDSKYWSTTPYRLGDGAVKYLARPVGSPAVPEKPIDSPDRLRLAIAARLANGPAEFDFLVQTQIDPVAMPIEDPTVEWLETRSPGLKVATIRIPAQTFDSPGQLEACEGLSFTPWHTLPDHRPLGGVNRSRRPVYLAVSRRRHESNETPREEPTLAFVDSVWPVGAGRTQPVGGST